MCDQHKPGRGHNEALLQKKNVQHVLSGGLAEKNMKLIPNHLFGQCMEHVSGSHLALMEWAMGWEESF